MINVEDTELLKEQAFRTLLAYLENPQGGKFNRDISDFRGMLDKYWIKPRQEICEIGGEKFQSVTYRWNHRGNLEAMPND